MPDQKILKKKICLLGSFGVGKTSMIHRFVYDIFDDSYLTTIGTKVSQKSMPKLVNKKGESVRHDFLIWDIEGYEDSLGLIKSYSTGAAGAVLVCDVTRSETIDILNTIIKDFKQVNPKADIIIAGNKSDLVDQNCRNTDMLMSLAGRTGQRCLLTSALSGMNIEECFSELSKMLLNNTK